MSPRRQSFRSYRSLPPLQVLVLIRSGCTPLQSRGSASATASSACWSLPLQLSPHRSLLGPRERLRRLRDRFSAFSSSSRASASRRQNPPFAKSEPFRPQRHRSQNSQRRLSVLVSSASPLFSASHRCPTTTTTTTAAAFLRLGLTILGCRCVLSGFITSASSSTSSASSIASMIAISPDTTGAQAPAQRVAVLNFSIEKSGDTKCGSAFNPAPTGHSALQSARHAPASGSSDSSQSPPALSPAPHGNGHACPLLQSGAGSTARGCHQTGSDRCHDNAGQGCVVASIMPGRRR